MDKSIFENADHFLIDTGNLINCNELKRKASQSAKDELIESLIYTANGCLQSPDNLVQDGCIILKNPQQTLIENDERKDLKLTVKVFLVRYDCDLLRESIEKVISHLRVDILDSVILALSSPLPQTSSILEELGPLWRVLEKMLEEKKLVTIGVSDLDTQTLDELYNWAKIKPTVNQVNLESCCVMPPEMTLFAKEHDIQLLTHSDPKVIITTESLSEAIHPILDAENAQLSTWEPEWIARYSAIVKYRGIIQNRGYVISAKRNNQDVTS